MSKKTQSWEEEFKRLYLPETLKEKDVAYGFYKSQFDLIQFFLDARTNEIIEEIEQEFEEIIKGWTTNYRCEKYAIEDLEKLIKEIKQKYETKK